MFRNYMGLIPDYCPKWQHNFLHHLCFFLPFILLHSVLFAELPGSWELLIQNAGIASMHTAVTHFGTVVLLDRTNVGASRISLAAGKCRDNANDRSVPHDCTAHSVLFTPEDNSIRPLTIQTDTWCSSGQFLPNGTLLQTGGYLDGKRKIRRLIPCPSAGICDWEELQDMELATYRWYATDQLLPDGSVIIVGGKKQYNVEFILPANREGIIALPFLVHTADQQMDNLYPYVHLLPDGNLFIFANQDAILFDYKTRTIVRTYPRLEGNPRNYPSAGSSAMLPLSASDGYSSAEIIVCGGAQFGAFQHPSEHLPANGSCGRIRATDDEAIWEIEEMPFRRIMGDMVMLPTGDILIINGAQAGSQGFNLATAPCLNPVLYQPEGPPGLRFMILTPTVIPRMYHSTANLLPDGRILVCGSNPHYSYNFSDEFPTELRIEAFSPEYLSAELSFLRPFVLGAPDVLTYGAEFFVHFEVPLPLTQDLEVNLASTPFVTHSFAQGQRLIKLEISHFQPDDKNTYTVTAIAPPDPVVAPPSYYMMFLINQGIPSHATWVQLMSA